ncbi:MAG TPA: TolC family outer membrane protein [Xanthomonadaceae bacterium]|nr:TolC family outer membrane protein [Xanthomonadaceae bacterium]
MSIRLSLIAATVVIALSAPASGADLVQIYELARQSDPQLQQAESNRYAEAENIVQTRAGLLPSLSGSATLSRGSSETDFDDGSVDKSNSRSRSYGLSLSQSIYNHANYTRLRGARAQLSRVDAEYESALNGLLLRVSERYFDVLTAVESLVSANAEERAVKRQLEQAEQRFEVGLTAITDVHEARARYDGARANAIAAQNALDDAREALAELTGRSVDAFKALGEDLPLDSPSPAGAEAWVELAVDSNPSLIARRYSVDAAGHSVDTARASHLPTLGLSASYSDGAAWGGVAPPVRARGTQSDSISLTLSVPIFEGFGTQSRVRQSIHFRDIALDQFEAERRSVLRQTRNAYRAVVAGISEVEARRQALVSARSALEATQAGFEVGTRTIVDVLLSQQQLFAAQREYARSRHSFIVNNLRLKAAAGVIEVSDLQYYNRLLVRNLSAADLTPDYEG